MSRPQTELQTDTWVAATWAEYCQMIEDPAYAKAHGYYYRQHLRIEMAPVGHDHAFDNTTITLAVNLFGISKGIALKGLTNCSYRKTGISECQPDVSFYIGNRTQLIPWETNIINLDRYPVPDLVIEIANTSLLDDQGAKRLLYEDLEIREYWIVDVQSAQIIAFAIGDRGSRRIDVSQVLPGLLIATLETALSQSRQLDQSQVGAWLLQQFQA